MNYLKVATVATSRPDQYIVYWTNKWLDIASHNSPKGAVLVDVPLSVEDKHIIAELFALKFLLEDKEVIGPNLAGHKNIRLVVSSGAPKKLRGKRSDKTHLVKFASFLQTRFRDSPLKVEDDLTWVRNGEVEPSDHLIASYDACVETVEMLSLGRVVVSAHVVEQFATRLYEAKMTEHADREARTPEAEHTPPNPVTMGEAWRTLRKMATSKDIKELELKTVGRLLKHRDEARYFRHPSGWVFVVTFNQREGHKLVTVHPRQR